MNTLIYLENFNIYLENFNSSRENASSNSRDKKARGLLLLFDAVPPLMSTSRTASHKTASFNINLKLLYHQEII